MRKFALWTAGSKGTSKKRKASSAVPTANNGAVEPSHKKTKHAVAAFENRDVCRGTLLSVAFFFVQVSHEVLTIDLSRYIGIKPKIHIRRAWQDDE
jgi:hypothetical protein